MNLPFNDDSHSNDATNASIQDSVNNSNIEIKKVDNINIEIIKFLKNKYNITTFKCKKVEIRYLWENRFRISFLGKKKVEKIEYDDAIVRSIFIKVIEEKDSYSIKVYEDNIYV